MASGRCIGLMNHRMTGLFLENGSGLIRGCIGSLAQAGLQVEVRNPDGRVHGAKGWVQDANATEGMSPFSPAKI
ncbi:MAG: hypothetical protein BWY82_01226 [Verrucomicrobia bacterium ADurb.Bin474]|nr:MAG: hypothetical protein BWY82_01226 [Verrucomicrobia bacterium ADurb.Bin474]